jgi:hypothetical protein
MAVDLRGHPMFPTTGVNTPTRFESNVFDCEVWEMLGNHLNLLAPPAAK